MLYLSFRTTLTTGESLRRLDDAHRELDPIYAAPQEYMGELRRHAIAESVHFSTRIEGNTLTLEQVEDLLRGEQVSAPPDQIQEAQNYREAMEYAQSVATSQHPRLSEDTVRAIHFIVTKSLPGEYAPGRYRQVQNAVIDKVTKRRLFYPPPPDQVEGLMEEFVRWANSSHEGMHAYYRAALTHLNFVAIHPFLDGNGRTARILETLVLYLAGYKSQDLVSLEAFFGRDTQRYYTAIATSLGTSYRPDGAEITPWVEYHLDAHAQQAINAVQEMQLVDRQFDALQEAFINDERVGWHIYALWRACFRGSITNSTYRDASGVGNQTAAKHLASLVDGGLLARRGAGRGIHYVPTEATVLVFESVSQP